MCVRERIFMCLHRGKQKYMCVRVQVERVIQRRVDDLTLLCFSPG